jgi:citrate synthase
MAIGLDDVMAAETVLSHVDGEAGRLILRGRDLEEVAGRLGYEAVTALLWDGVVAGTPAAEDLRAALGAARVAAFARFHPLLPWLDGLAPIEAMRFMLAAIPDGERQAEPLQAVGAAGVAASLVIRRAAGQGALAPDGAAGHAADLLRMLRGRPGAAEEIGALDTYLVTIIDHGLNASTFAARVVASTGAGLPSAVVAALTALKGPLHGGAPGPVLDMLDAVGSAERAPGWIAAALDRGERLMGFGHRVYRIRDPRADVLRAALGRLPVKPDRLALAEAVETAALEALRRRKAERRLDTNVEFYTALLLEALAVPRAGFTALFAAGRAAGWAAHIREQEASGRILRPRSRYIGPWPVEAA